MGRMLAAPIGALRTAAEAQWYAWRGQRPWKRGYAAYRQRYLMRVLHDSELFRRFAGGEQLPEGYGLRLDERVVEYPWVLSRLNPNNKTVLDAGSTLNFDYLLDLPILREKAIVIYTLAPEGVVQRSNVSYVYGDLRQTILRNALCDEIVCISTLEHIGMDNARVYTHDERHREFRPDDYRSALQEFHRLLAPGGHLFITVPYGRYTNFGWWQQFDRKLLDDAVHAFAGRLVSSTFYKYTSSGWRLSDADDCRDAEYFDMRARPDYDPDFAAAARAVACLHFAV